MSTLSNLATRLQQFAVGSTRPDRDELVAERDALLASPPLPPENTLAALEPPQCSCEHCTARFREEQSRRVTHAAWAARVRVLETMLFQLTWGDPSSADDEAKGRDEPGLALAELCSELIRAIDTARMRPWERIIERDGRGKPLKAWETAAQLGAVTAELVALYRRATTAMIYLSAGELTTAIAETRARMGAALVTPLRRPIDPELAERAGTQSGETGEAERLGLTPGQDPSVLSGTIRFARKGRA